MSNCLFERCWKLALFLSELLTGQTKTVTGRIRIRVIPPGVLGGLDVGKAPRCRVQAT